MPELSADIAGAYAGDHNADFTRSFYPETVYYALQVPEIMPELSPLFCSSVMPEMLPL